MDNKCSKYEGLFVFGSEKDFREHVETCEECKKEHEKMEQVSGLLDEVKFYYRSKRKKMKKLRAICAIVCLILFTSTAGVVYFDDDLSDSLMYGDTLSAEDLGFPVDSYGLLMVDE